MHLDIFQEGFWHKLVGIQDNELRSLAERLKTTVLKTKAASTTLIYLRSLRHWKAFADKYAAVQYFPADPLHVALYLQHVMETTKSHHSVDTALYAIRWAHKLAGLPSPTDNPMVSSITQGVKRIK